MQQEHTFQESMITLNNANPSQCHSQNTG